MIDFMMKFQEINQNLNLNYDIKEKLFGVIFDMDEKCFNSDFESNNKQFDIHFNELQKVNEAPTSYKYYDGDYSVIPKIQSQTLETREKIMKDDLEVKAIPYFETSNDSGTTIYIAKEI